MKVLGIDPGYGRCGVAIVEKEAGHEHVIYSSCIETSADLPFPKRLAHVADGCTILIRQHAPEAVALEKLYFNANQKTAMQVAEVRGAVLYVAECAGLAIFEYTPSQVKSATTGWGKSDKAAVAQMLRTLLHIEKNIQHDDEYDAIAVGITHLASFKRPA
jgi:crossover junction endodeoxyribonuclease RuvC